MTTNIDGNLNFDSAKTTPVIDLAIRATISRN